MEPVVIKGRRWTDLTDSKFFMLDDYVETIPRAVNKVEVP